MNYSLNCRPFSKDINEKINNNNYTTYNEC